MNSEKQPEKQILRPTLVIPNLDVCSNKSNTFGKKLLRVSNLLSFKKKKYK